MPLSAGVNSARPKSLLHSEKAASKCIAQTIPVVRFVRLREFLSVGALRTDIILATNGESDLSEDAN